MIYKNINGTNLNPSTICLGSVPFCIEDGLQFSYELLDTFTELGGNFIDTANVYGKWLPGGKSISEIIIGKWIKDRQNRHKLIIETKGAHPELSTMHISRITKADVAADLEESLRNLQTDYIDIYLLHRDDEKFPAGEIITYLNDFVREGKIRYFGCSNWKPYRIKEAFAYAEQHGLDCFKTNQMFWNLAVLNENPFDDTTLVFMDKEGYDFHNKTGMTATPFTSQAGGFFDKLAKQQEKPLSQQMKRAYYNEENLGRFERIKKVAEDLAVSTTEIVLGYLLSQPFTTIPIIGPSSVEQLKSSMNASDIRLDKQILDYLIKG